ncbi:MAG: hypothetical protein LBT14_01220 [Treponema sp.]|jgi:hypothetical protein|nr:hypothetical protein [Treponema sp.]
MTDTVFRKESLDHISSPDQLYDYIKVSNPAGWIILAALLMLLVSAFFWAATATIATTVSTKAVAEGDRYVSYLPYNAAQGIQPGMSARIGDNPAKVLRIAAIPESHREAAQALRGDYAAYALGLTEWNIKVEFVLEPSGDGRSGEKALVYPVTITTARIRPLDFLKK